VSKREGGRGLGKQPIGDSALEESVAVFFFRPSFISAPCLTSRLAAAVFWSVRTVCCRAAQRHVPTTVVCIDQCA
jgi:hypothetical protein